jgi:hypothetical protein
MTNADGGAQTRWYPGPGGFFLAACLLLSVLPPAFTLAYRLLKGPLERLDMENRLAQRMPVPRRESLLDGSFQRGFERCLADQLPVAPERAGAGERRLWSPLSHATPSHRRAGSLG